VRVKTLLQLGETGNVLGKQRLAVVLVEVEPAGVGAVEGAELETIGIIDAEMLDELLDLHWTWLQTCLR
jgi:hypothetical protein